MGHFETRILHKLMLEGAAHSITCHEQFLLNRVCYFPSLAYSLAPMNQNLNNNSKELAH